LWRRAKEEEGGNDDKIEGNREIVWAGVGVVCVCTLIGELDFGWLLGRGYISSGRGRGGGRGKQNMCVSLGVEGGEEGRDLEWVKENGKEEKEEDDAN